MYSAYDQQSSRSPGSHRNQQGTLNRMPSRQFDAYQQQLGQSSLYPQQDDHQRGYDQPRNYNERLNNTIHAGYGYDMGAQQGWNTNAFSQNGLGSLGGAAGQRMKSQTRGGGRSALPQGWMEPPPPQSQGLPSFALPGLGNGASSAMLNTSYGHDVDEELIPTAIVIKNIPFAVKKEQLVQLMTDLRLPLPYAFNYHFDNGVFRGLAFANFTTAEETAAVIESMNHFELNGRKLRVEYKKMLPLAERERIEREKRERRGQLEEQHRPLGGQLHSQASFGSLASHSHIPAASPSPVSAMRQQKIGMPHNGAQERVTNGPVDVDLNDPQILQFYSQLLLFKESPERDSMTFPPSLAPPQRRIIHTLAHQLDLAHVSKGSGDTRQVHIFKVHNNQGLSPPMPQMPTSHPTEQPGRRGLNRAATTDFSDVRASEGFYNAFGRQASGLLGFPDSPGGLNAVPNLRGAKSYADLRSYTPSPAPSTASHPVGRPGGISLEGLGFSGSNTNPNGTPTASSMSQRNDGMLEREMERMTLGANAFGQSSSPRSLRQMTSWENPGPIGGHRAFSSNYDDRPSRQPRGPLPERGQGFSRPRQNGHQGRGSDELSSQSNVEILVGQ
ncbi:Peptidyl-prolyl cis-trans isomerase pin4 [Didymella pomorum]|uniref:Peptidyl-prolyl cis-trans isomerase pin4 n=1 Tax=Didymella pomorum TaxID=749634 RepID=A0A9W8ZB19_9PLEO|nr:Peptidyl-prolyl cis-trans isomerase pin4 [Didymella pomorum]